MIEKWFAVQPEHAHGWWVVSKDEEGYDNIDESHDGGFEEKTAKRIALVPEYEQFVKWIVENPACHVANIQQVAKTLLKKLEENNDI